MKSIKPGRGPSMLSAVGGLFAMAFGILLIVVLLNVLLNRLTKGEFSI